MLIEAQERVISEGYYPFRTKLALGISWVINEQGVRKTFCTGQKIAAIETSCSALYWHSKER